MKDSTEQQIPFPFSGPVAEKIGYPAKPGSSRSASVLFEAAYTEATRWKDEAGDAYQFTVTGVPSKLLEKAQMLIGYTHAFGLFMWGQIIGNFADTNLVQDRRDLFRWCMLSRELVQRARCDLSLLEPRQWHSPQRRIDELIETARPLFLRKSLLEPTDEGQQRIERLSEFRFPVVDPPFDDKSNQYVAHWLKGIIASVHRFATELGWERTDEAVVHSSMWAVRDETDADDAIDAVLAWCGPQCLDESYDTSMQYSKEDDPDRFSGCLPPFPVMFRPLVVQHIVSQLTDVDTSQRTFFEVVMKRRVEWAVAIENAHSRVENMITARLRKRAAKLLRYVERIAVARFHMHILNHWAEPHRDWEEECEMLTHVARDMVECIGCGMNYGGKENDFQRASWLSWPLIYGPDYLKDAAAHERWLERIREFKIPSDLNDKDVVDFRGNAIQILFHHLRSSFHAASQQLKCESAPIPDEVRSVEDATKVLSHCVRWCRESLKSSREVNAEVGRKVREGGRRASQRVHGASSEREAEYREAVLEVWAAHPEQGISWVRRKVAEEKGVHERTVLRWTKGLKRPPEKSEKNKTQD